MDKFGLSRSRATIFVNMILSLFVLFPALVHSTHVIRFVSEIYTTGSGVESTNYHYFPEVATEPYFHPTSRTYSSIFTSLSTCNRPINYQMDPKSMSVVFDKLVTDNDKIGSCLYHLMGVRSKGELVNEQTMESDVFEDVEELYLTDSVRYSPLNKKLTMITQDKSNDSLVTVDADVKWMEKDDTMILLNRPMVPSWLKPFALDWTCRNWQCNITSVAPSLKQLTSGERTIDQAILLTLVSLNTDTLDTEVVGTADVVFSSLGTSMQFNATTSVPGKVFMVCNMYGFCRSMRWGAVEEQVPPSSSPEALGPSVLDIVLYVLGGASGLVIIGLIYWLAVVRPKAVLAKKTVIV